MIIHELTLQAFDLDTQQDFYSALLGLETIRQESDLIITVGTTRLIFTQATPGSTPKYHFAINIPENLFAEAHAWLGDRMPLLRRNQTQDVFDFEAWNAHACYFPDPAGNILELIARHNLPNATAGPFRPQHLLCISEIGLPGPDVAHVVDTLAAGPALHLWSGDREQFAAVGDEHGLFIIVPEGRLWLPDDRVPAVACPVEAVIAGNVAATFHVPDLPYTIRVTPAYSGASTGYTHGS